MDGRDGFRMKKEMKIREILPESICMTPKGFLTDQLSKEEFMELSPLFFDVILQISRADINGITGYGEFDNECKTKYESCRDFLIGTFEEEQKGYWYHWREMFQTEVLDQEFFETYFKKMEELIPYCENQRFLMNNNTFFVNMITDGKTMIGFPDWSSKITVKANSYGGGFRD